MKVLVLGAGGLSLGLLCPIIYECGHEPFLVSRVSSSPVADRLRELADSGRILLSDLRQNEIGWITIGGFLDLGEPEERATIIEYVNDEEFPLVVAAARDGFTEFSSLLRQNIAGRQSNLVLVSADNSPPQSWYELSASEARGFECTSSIADRICIRFSGPGDVMVENYRSWIVQSDQQGLCAKLFGDHPGVQVVEDVSPLRQRKLICVNGLQLALSLFARTDDRVDPAVSARLDRWIASRSDLAGSIAEAVAHAYVGLTGTPLEETRVVCAAALFRFADTPDRTGRMLGLSEGQLSGNPLALIARLDERILPLVEHDGTALMKRALVLGRKIAETWQG